MKQHWYVDSRIYFKIYVRFQLHEILMGDGYTEMPTFTRLNIY